MTSPNNTTSPTEAVEKLNALRRMCESCQQDFYVEILDEVLSALASIPAGVVEERLREALTPSAETKAAYIGEFSFEIGAGYDKHGNELYRSVDVPWTTVKEIMAAIRERAALNQGDTA